MNAPDTAGVADSDTTGVLLSRLHSLSDTLEAEARCLMEGDPAALHEISRSKDMALAAVERIAATLRGAAPGAQTDAWLEAIEPDAARRDELREALADCAERNRANGLILARLRRSTARQLALLTGRPTETVGYGARGGELQSERSRPLARA